MKKTSNFKIGDRVKVTRLQSKIMEAFVCSGDIGTVVQLSSPNYPELACMVELDEFNTDGNYNVEQYFKEVLGQPLHEEVYVDINAIGFLDIELELI